MVRVFWILLFLGGYCLTSNGQSVQVSQSPEKMLQNPWTGGFDACQFGWMDLDGDQKNDLVVFDRRGNRLSAFLNRGLTNEIVYQLSAEMVSNFPQLAEWVIFTDYNADGFKDIFTYSPGWAGIKVYKNKKTFPPSFDLVVWPYLSSFQGGGYVNIISTNADYPAIYDIDGDGDLDMLNFWSLGTYIELHKNQSMEKYGHADSLDFIKTDFCWGRVAENEENNQLYLDSCLFGQKPTHPEDGFRHRGATMLMHDFDNNGLPDLLLADVDYPGITLLTNGGTLENALIVSQDTSFPSYDTPVHLFSMPVVAFADVNNDGLDDLLVSPFDPNPLVTANKASIWLYLNVGTIDQPQFELLKKDFLQDETLDFGSGAFPVMVDVDRDGVNDLVVGNIGNYLRSWFINNTLHSEFKSSLFYYKLIEANDQKYLRLVDDDLAGLSALKMQGLAPAFYDLNGDGKDDLMVGNENGTLIYLTQTHDGGWQLETDHFLQIDVGHWSSPQFFDVDEDGIKDLLIGSQNGKIAFYKGVQNGKEIGFQFVTDFFGQVDVTDYSVSYDGYSVPFFFYDPNGTMRLISGSNQGKLFLFDQIQGNLVGAFREVFDWKTLINHPLPLINEGMRSAACWGKFSSEDDFILLKGNFSGGLQLFNGEVAVAPYLAERLNIQFDIVPNPAVDEFQLKLPEKFASVNLKIYSLEGLLLLQKEVETHNPISIAGLKKGMYLVEIEAGRQKGFQKLVKQ